MYCKCRELKKKTKQMHMSNQEHVLIFVETVIGFRQILFILNYALNRLLTIII